MGARPIVNVDTKLTRIRLVASKPKIGPRFWESDCVPGDLVQDDQELSTDTRFLCDHSEEGRTLFVQLAFPLYYWPQWPHDAQ